MIALRNKERILARNCTIVDENLPKWDAFFARYPDLFDWRRPDGSCMAFPQYKGTEGVDAFCTTLVEESGVLFLPSTIYSSELGSTPNDRLRLGFGRSNLDEGIEVLDEHLSKNAKASA